MRRSWAKLMAFKPDASHLALTGHLLERQLPAPYWEEISLSKRQR